MGPRSGIRVVCESPRETMVTAKVLSPTTSACAEYWPRSPSNTMSTRWSRKARVTDATLRAVVRRSLPSAATSST